MIRWETSVSAGFGEDGQSVVNQQIGDDYDAIICVFWGRIGSQTPRARSGTVEEYQRALDRYKNKEDIELAFFFKDAPIPMKNIDPRQIEDLNGFRRSVQSAGAFNKDFSNEKDFSFEIDLLLDKLSHRFGANIANKANRNAIPSADIIDTHDDDSRTESNLVAVERLQDDSGLIDVSERITENANITAAFLNEMTEMLDTLTTETSESATQLRELTNLGAVQPADAKPVIHRVSASMNKFSDFLEGGSTDFSQRMFQFASDTRVLIDISRDFDADEADIGYLKPMLETLSAVMRSSIESLVGMRDQAVGLQRMTKDLNIAKRRLAFNVDFLVEEIRSSSLIIDQAIDALDKLDE